MHSVVSTNMLPNQRKKKALRQSNGNVTTVCAITVLSCTQRIGKDIVARLLLWRYDYAASSHMHTDAKQASRYVHQTFGVLVWFGLLVCLLEAVSPIRIGVSILDSFSVHVCDCKHDIRNGIHVSNNSVLLVLWLVR